MRARLIVGGLTDFRAGRVNEWVGLFAAAARTAAMEASRFASQLAELEAQWHAAVGPLRANAAASVLLRLLPGVPIIDVQTAEELVGCSNQAARLALAQLERAGVISQLTVGAATWTWIGSGLR